MSSKKQPNPEQQKLDELRAAIAQKMAESGEREKIKDQLRTKLVESGWRDAMKNHCREIIKQKGLDAVTAEDLVQEITPKGRAEVPLAVKQELQTRIRKYLATINEPKAEKTK